MSLASDASPQFRTVAELLHRLGDIAFTREPGSRGRVRHVSPSPVSRPTWPWKSSSQSNTKKEMQRKLVEYFDAGVRLVWMIDPKTRSALVYHSTKAPTKLDDGQALDGEGVLPGFTLALSELFECLDRGRDD